MLNMVTLQTDAASVPDVLKATRNLAGLTTRAIAPLLGVSHSTVAKWERGEGEPTVTQFVLWARATKQPAEQLLSGLSIQDVRPKGLEPLTFWLGVWWAHVRMFLMIAMTRIGGELQWNSDRLGHLTTDPTCVEARPVRAGSFLDRASRGLACGECMAKRAFADSKATLFGLLSHAGEHVSADLDQRIISDADKTIACSVKGCEGECYLCREVRA